MTLLAEKDLPSRPRGAMAPVARAAPVRRVAFVVNHHPAGGAQQILENIGAGLRADGFDTHFFALHPHDHATHAPSGKAVWVCVSPAKPKTPLALIRMFRSLASELRAYQPDAIISALPMGNIGAIISGRLAAPRARVIVTHHSSVETHNKLFNFIDGFLGRWRNVSDIVGVSSVVTKSLRGKSKAYLAKSKTIHNALPPEIEKLLARLAVERAGRTDRPRTVVATGRLSTQKNYPVLLRAAVRMPDVGIIIVGGGEDEAALKKMARDLGVAERVTFLGIRTREETLRELSMGGVFVQPSLFEGHSLALIEAAKLNIPIVVSNVPEQIEGVTAADGEICGALVDPHDDEALAREILDLLDVRANYDAAEARSRRLADSFQYDQMVVAYEELLK